MKFDLKESYLFLTKHKKYGKINLRKIKLCVLVQQRGKGVNFSEDSKDKILILLQNN